MRRLKILLLVAGIASLFTACKKDPEDEKPCDMVPAGSGLRFRVTDSGGKDYLHMNSVLPEVLQPCRATPLEPIFTTYAISNTTDTGILISFGDVRTPIYGESGECYRIFFNWGTDVDTLDWHYRVDESGHCTQQLIDYISFNGLQVEMKSDNRFSYYRLIK